VGYILDRESLEECKFVHYMYSSLLSRIFLAWSWYLSRQTIHQLPYHHRGELLFSDLMYPSALNLMQFTKYPRLYRSTSFYWGVSSNLIYSCFFGEYKQPWNFQTANVQIKAPRLLQRKIRVLATHYKSNRRLLAEINLYCLVLRSLFISHHQF
jgi:hypothetical protein